MPSEYVKILLIEDDPLHAQLIEAMIVAENGGFEPVIEMRLESGLARLIQNDIDLILLDLTLPDSEGLETLLRTHERAPQLPIIVLTGAEDGEDARRAMVAGAQDYLIKWEMDHRLLQQTMRYAIERKRAEIARQDHERTIRRIAEALPEIIALIEPETGKLTFINDQVTRMLGYSIAEAQTFTYKTLVHPEDQHRLNRHFDRLLAEPEKNDSGIEYRVRHVNGEWRWLNSRHIVYSNRQDGRNEGRLVQILCAAHDATEQAQAKAALHESEERLRFALDAAGLGAWEWKIDSDKMVEDDVSRQLIGNESAGLEGFLSRVIPEDRERVRLKIEQALASRQNYSLEFRVSKPDGQIRWIETQARLMCAPDGTPARMVGVVRDITEKKRLEGEIYRTQRLESIGALASGIAHDLNNVMAPILMALHTLQQRFTDEYSRRWLSLVQRSAERGRDLIEQMMAFAKGASGERLPLQLKALAEDLVKMLNETLPKNVEFDVRLPEGLWAVIGDGTQIHQVLMNLCLNARDAMPHGGKLSISAENLTLDEDEAQRHSEVKSGRFIQIVVTDTGIGISPQIIDQIFDPFFTTKEKGKGTGLGLSTVLGIARGHGGFIDVQSEVGRGSKFYVYLPAREINVMAVKEAQPQEPLNGHGELILVVDDEPDICEVAKHTLESCGYRVLTALDGEEAVEIFRRHPREVAVVLTDMIMPNLDGSATIRALKKINSCVKIIATSGLRSTSKMAEAANPDIDVFLPKPYTTETLLGLISSLLSH